MNKIYLTYNDYLEQHQKDFKKYQDKYPDATPEDFLNDLKKQYEIFDFDNECINIFDLDKKRIVSTVTPEELNHFFSLSVDIFALSPYDPIDETEKLFSDYVFGNDIQITQVDYISIPDFKNILLLCDIDKDEFEITFNKEKFKNLEYAYKKIFLQPITTDQDNDQDIDKLFDDAKRHKSSKSKLNQKQVILLGILIQKHMFEYDVISNIRLAKGLDIIFDSSHNNIRNGLGYSKKTKLNNQQLDELSEILKKMISEIEEMKK